MSMPLLKDPIELAGAGIYLCRKENWAKGIEMLAEAVEQAAKGRPLPSRAYSYLGYGIGRYQGRAAEGAKLCRHALRLEFTEPDNHVNLVRLYLYADKRRDAYSALETGLAMAPQSPTLIELAEEMGVRRQPVLPMFSRRNLINRLLGRIRHALSASR